MEKHKKRRGISLTRIVEKPSLNNSQGFDKSNVCLVRSNAVFSNQIGKSLSIPYAQRSSSTPKPFIRFTYTDSGVSENHKQVQLSSVIKTQRPMYVATPSKQQGFIEQTLLQQQKTVRQRAFGGENANFEQCKDTIKKRLFIEQTPKLSYQNGARFQSTIYSGQDVSFQKMNQEFYSTISYNEVINRKRHKLQIQKDVVSYKLRELAQPKSLSETTNKESGGSYWKSPNKSHILQTDAVKVRSDAKQDKDCLKKLQNLKQMQKKLRQIIQICGQTGK